VGDQTLASRWEFLGNRRSWLVASLRSFILVHTHTPSDRSRTINRRSRQAWSDALCSWESRRTDFELLNSCSTPFEVFQEKTVAPRKAMAALAPDWVVSVTVRASLETAMVVQSDDAKSDGGPNPSTCWARSLLYLTRYTLCLNHIL
jgi:hypothetical protein